METKPQDADFLQKAVEMGAITGSQVEDCLRERDRQISSSGGAAKPLQTVALEKGYLTERRILEIAAEQKKNQGSSSVSIQIGMTCAGCGLDYPTALQDALNRPRCRICDAPLSVRAPSPDTSRRPFSAPLPEAAARASGNPKNRFGKYVLVSKLGSGGMGEVFKAWDTVLGRWVALKMPRSMGDEEIRRLYLEAQGAGRLSHPNIASVYEIAEFDGRHYIAMQFIEGLTAEQSLVAGTKPDFREIVRWIRDAALGAHYAHERGVIHRDFKPQNLMIDVDGRVYVMDFGLAKLSATTGSGTVSGAILGTPSFMSPEQASGRPSEVDRRSDVYSLGSTLYVLLSGQKPFEGETITEILVRILTVEPPLLRDVAPAVPAELAAIVGKSMRRAKPERYPTAKDLADELSRFLSGDPVQARPATLTRRIARKAKSQKAVLIGVAAAILALGAGLMLSRPGPAGPPPPARPDRLAEWTALFASIRDAASSDRFDPDRAGPLLAAARKDFAEQKPALDSFLDGQRNLALASITALPRAQWRDPAQRSRIERLRSWLAFAGFPTAEADRILAYRGSCTIELLVRPAAELRGPGVSGLSAEQRSTPTAFRDFEVVDGELELHRPGHGTAVVGLKGLQDGKRYVIEGDWKDGDRLEAKENP